MNKTYTAPEALKISDEAASLMLGLDKAMNEKEKQIIAKAYMNGYRDGYLSQEQEEAK